LVFGVFGGLWCSMFWCFVGFLVLVALVFWGLGGWGFLDGLVVSAGFGFVWVWGAVLRVSLLRGLRRLHGLRELDPVPGELRGWSWDSPPVRPRAYLGLGVSEVAYRYCPTLRDLWLRRRGVQGRSAPALEAGRLVHEVFAAASGDLRRLASRGVPVEEAVGRLLARGGRRGWPWWASRLYRRLVLLWGGEAAAREMLGGLGWLPWLHEYVVDGSPLGLSRGLRVDALGEAGVVVEVKLGRNGGRGHEVALAGYAMALEAETEAPVDYGVLVYVYDLEGAGGPRLRVSPVYLGPGLREEFLRLRDEAIDLLLSGAEPPRARSCRETCPFHSVCWPKEGSGGDVRG